MLLGGRSSQPNDSHKKALLESKAIYGDLNGLLGNKHILLFNRHNCG